MSSLLRTLQRKRQRRNGTFEAAPQPTEADESGYVTLRPTKGWMRMTAKRLVAQRRMAYLLGDR